MARDHVDRDLLFGLLALKTRSIDREALIAAFEAWSRDGSRGMADILDDRGALLPTRRPAIEALVIEHLEAHGLDPGRSLAALDLDQATREILNAPGDPDLDATLSMVGQGSTQVDDFRLLDSPEDVPRGAGSERFRVLRPHARGGLGAVFVALDSELNREVALKQILDRHADDPSSRSRFVLEAEITGNLEHPGIVPVYGMGTFVDGRPYYAMRFIQGDSLKDAIAAHHRGAPDSRGLELRKLLRRFLDVCNAVEYAHQRGVLHRDLKPSNVMVGKFGETLVVDWGLAKAMGSGEPGAAGGGSSLVPPSASGSVETLPGSAIGTPSYMSPEQAAGNLDRLGPRSDVYSLGATLYCLLAGRPPFDGPDPVAVMKAVQEGVFPPPRALNPSIDRALEAICLKAMARRPEDRYPSAAGLAEDVERWAADEVVAAYPEPLPRRAARWARHHASVVTGSGAFLVAAVVALAAITWLVSRYNSRLERANAEVDRQGERAKTGSTMARRAVREMLREVSRSDLLNVPQAEPVRVKLTERALAFYREFVRLHPDEPAFELEQARLEEEVASLYRMTGKYDLADREYRNAVAILDRLIARDRDAIEARYLLANTESQFGEMIKQRGGADFEAEPHYRQAVELARHLREARPSTAKYLSLFSRTGNDHAAMLATSGRLDEAEPLARDAVEAAMAYRSTMPSKPDPANFDLDWVILPLIQTTHGAILARSRRSEEAEATLRRAVGSFRDLIVIYPESNDPRYLLADALKELGAALATDDARLDEALKALDEAIEHVTPLLVQFPNVVFYPRSLALLRADRGAVRLAAGRLDPAGEDLEAAHRHLDPRVRAEVNAIEPIRELAKVKASLARLARKRGLIVEAREHAERAVDLQRRALAIGRDSRFDKDQLDAFESLRSSLAAPK